MDGGARRGFFQRFQVRVAKEQIALGVAGSKNNALAAPVRSVCSRRGTSAAIRPLPIDLDSLARAIDHLGQLSRTRFAGSVGSTRQQVRASHRNA